ncbi:MAG: ribosome biogenesis GTP-binding protein YihA/YsxC [Proteobacteria bacterium]|nr:ribosome biogenesis GTP-binding protein YihA/YsxC [Pseudomonadota bacterium]MBU4297925.1 ribosome biogenesis GTP-binding protein YihA/YsxC [Pseudomonadota bacterium]MCG2747971.1 ribosome biogenesis GTP-binding protein YihA/YsxC [Desulfobulbaceae bacterium]
MAIWQNGEAVFITSVFNTSQLPEPQYPEIAFAGRSNVGKSSLINKLLNRRDLVKVSSVPGKTQSLNFFQLNQDFYLVDLPGYGYAKVPKRIKNDWKGLISSYILNRQTLICVVVIIDIRHEVKSQDLELVTWLKDEHIPLLLVYTKQDKLTGNKRLHHAAVLDAGFGISREERVLFSAKTGEGREELISKIEQFAV